MFNQWLPNLSVPPIFSIFSVEIIFIGFSCIIAIIIWLEGQMLKTTKGTMPKSVLFHIGSAIDSFWFVVAAAALYFLDFQSIEKSVPVVYMIYTIFGWIYGTALMSKDGLPDSPENLIIPEKYTTYSQSFALVFFGLCVAIIYMKFSGTCLPFS